jgi:hypothetical protein
MKLFASVRRLGTRAAGGFVACLLLLPMPVLAYTISQWTFVDNGASLQDNSVDHKTLVYGGSIGGPNFSAMGNSTITAVMPGEAVNTSLDMTGLSLQRGSLTVTIQIVGSGTVSFVITPGSPLTHNFPTLFLTGGTQQVIVKFQFSSDARFTFNGSSQGNLFFR